jgi:hypothetical protein
MKEAICQFKRSLDPASEEDLEALCEEFKFNQMVRVKVYKIDPLIEPSVKQNNLMHKCFELVADNSENPMTKTKQGAKFACKMALQFWHDDRVYIMPSGAVVFEPRSFSFKNLLDMERLRIFERAFEWCADQLGLTVDQLIEEAKKKMKGPRPRGGGD